MINAGPAGQPPQHGYAGDVIVGVVWGVGDGFAVSFHFSESVNSGRRCELAVTPTYVRCQKKIQTHLLERQ